MTIIDKETWPRRAHNDFFTPMSDPFYTLTFPVDVTPLRAWCRGRSLPFYPAMVFAVTKAMEAVDAFHYKDRDGVIVRHDTLVPSFTDLKPRPRRRPRPSSSPPAPGTGISSSTSPACPGSPSQP